MSTRARIALIPTHDRPGQFVRCLAAISPQVDAVIVIDHQSGYAHREPGTINLAWPEGIPNISQMWNLGISHANWLADGSPCDIAILNDDAIVPEDWFDKIVTGMRSAGAAAGASSPDDSFHFLDDPKKPLPRMPGFAFILSSEWDLRADEQFQWWWGDTDLDWRARQLSSVVLVPGVPVDHPPNGGGTTIGDLARIAGEDRQRFIDKWGFAPW